MPNAPYSAMPGMGTTDPTGGAVSPFVHGNRQLLFSDNLFTLLDVGLNRQAAGILTVTNGAAGKGLLSLAGLVSNLVTVTTSYTVLSTDSTIVSNAATLTVTLPSAVTAGAGRQYVVKNGPSGTATTVASTAGTIDGTTTDVSMTVAFQSSTYQSDGANWLKIAKV